MNVLAEAALRIGVNRQEYISQLATAEQDWNRFYQSVQAKGNVSLLNQAALTPMERHLERVQKLANLIPEGLGTAGYNLGVGASKQQMARELGVDGANHLKNYTDRLQLLDEALISKNITLKMHAEGVRNASQEYDRATGAVAAYNAQLASTLNERGLSRQQRYNNRVEELGRLKGATDTSGNAVLTDAGYAAGIRAAKQQMARELGVDGANHLKNYTDRLQLLDEALNSKNITLKMHAEGVRNASQEYDRATGSVAAFNARLASSLNERGMSPQQRYNERVSELGRLKGAVDDKGNPVLTDAGYAAGIRVAKQTLDDETGATERNNAAKQRAAAALMLIRGPAMQYQDGLRGIREQLHLNQITEEEYIRGEKQLRFTMDAQNQVIQNSTSGYRRLGIGLQQASYGVQDFLTVASMPGMGLGRALMSASNNFAQIFAMISPLKGAFLGLGVTVLSLIPSFIEMFTNTAEKSKKGVDQLKDSVDAFTESLKRAAAFRQQEFEIKGLNPLEQKGLKSTDDAKERLRQLEKEDRDYAEESASRRERMFAKSREESRTSDDRTASRFFGMFGRASMSVLKDWTIGLSPEEKRDRGGYISGKEYANTDEQRKAIQDEIKKLYQEEVNATAESKDRARIRADIIKKQEELRLTESTIAAQKEADEREEADKKNRDIKKKYNMERSAEWIARQIEDETSVIETEKKIRGAIDPIGQKADDILSEAESREAEIRRRYGDSRPELIAQSKQMAQEQIMELKNQLPKSKFEFTGAQELSRKIQMSLSPDEGLKAQKDTAKGVTESKKTLEDILIRLKNMKGGFI